MKVPHREHPERYIPVSRDTVVDNRPRLFREGVGLDTTVDEVNRLRCANERAVRLGLDKLLLGLFERLVGVDRLFESLAQLFGEARGVLCQTLSLPVHGRATVEAGLVRVCLVMYEQLREDADGLKTENQ